MTTAERRLDELLLDAAARVAALVTPQGDPPAGPDGAVDELRAALADLSVTLAVGSRGAPGDPILCRRLRDLRARLESHVLAASSLERVGLVDGSAQMLVRGARSLVPDLLHALRVAALQETGQGPRLRVPPR